MSTPSNTEPEFRDSQGVAPATMSATRPLYWSVRRELWENRSIYVTLIVVAALFLVGFLIATMTRLCPSSGLDAAQQRAGLERPHDVIAGVLALTAFIVGVFYCLEALHGERRDRSILFWKSLPVSDLTTVLSKASIPLVVLPLLVYAIAFSTQVTMLLLGSMVLTIKGLSVGTLWAELYFFQRALALLYGLIVIALWHAPIYAWLLLISGWARRTAFLWAVLPPLAIAGVERIAFGTSHIASLLKYRLIGWFAEAFVLPAKDSAAIGPLTSVAPGRFLSTPGLWIGLVLAAIFLVGAVRMRRYREPI